jgi:4-amino-4-deoxy-L-arabinose transferase-like glycosyltransferase
VTARRTHPAWLALGIVAWLALTLGVRTLALPDEGRYAGVAWEMLRSHDWLVPTIDGLPFFHKPPLFYWLTAASLSVFGNVAWAARVASLAGALLAVLSMHLLLRRWIGERVGTWTTVVLVTQPFFFVGAQFANLDMLVAGCITATIALAAHAALCLDSGHGDHRAPLVAAYATAALGILAKGLIGVLLPGAVVAIWLLVVQRTQLLPRLLLSPWGWLAFAMIAVPWFVVMELRFDDFTHYFFVDQHWHRYALGTFNNALPFWFLPAGIALLTLPWFPGLWAAWRSRAARRERPHAMLSLLMPVWFVVIVVFFSIPRSKLIGYVLPALPPLAALIADGIWLASRKPVRTLRRLVSVTVLAALACIGGVVGIRWLDTRSSEPLARTLAQRYNRGDPVIFVGGYYYDVPFLARLPEPVKVVEAWTAVDIAAHDNWRKELYEAARFAPELAPRILVDRPQLMHELCEGRVHWVLASPGAVALYPVLQSVPLLARTQRIGLWRIERPATCVGGGETPNDGSQRR